MSVSVFLWVIARKEKETAMCKENESRESGESNIMPNELGANNVEVLEKIATVVVVEEDIFSHGHGVPLPRLPLKEVVEELMLLGKVAGPVAATNLLLYSKSIISMLFLGHMGKIELAGGSLAIGFANVTGHSVMRGLSAGMDPICSQAYGAKRWSVLGQTYIKTFLLLLFAAVPISFLWLNVDSLFLRLGQDRVISNVAKGYLFVSLPELLAGAHLHPLRAFLRAQGLNSPSTLISACTTVLHLPITYLLVTYLNLGVKGIAFASVVYALNMNMGLLIYLVLSKSAIKPWAGPTFGSILKGWKPLLGLAVPSVFQVCLEWWWYEIVLFLSGLLTNPESSVAAMGILIQTTGTLYAFSFSLGLSLSQRVGQELGAGEPIRAQRAAIIGLLIGLSYGLLAFGLTIGLKSIWGKLYTNEDEVLKLVSSALPILGLAEVGNAPQTAACGVLTGSARPKLGVRINIAAFYLVGLPVACVLAFKLDIGFRGLWLGQVASQAACACLMYYTLYRTDWAYQAKRAGELSRAAGDCGDDVDTNLVP